MSRARNIVRAALLALPAIVAAGFGASPGLAASVEERIESGFDRGGESPGPLGPEGLAIPPDFGREETGPGDASLIAPAGGVIRLRTTLDPLDIEQRIDKGLTAAGEDSAFPPDLAFGAFQRGWFLTAFSLALERAEKSDAPAQTLLGVLLSRGLGVKQDLAAAADWFKLAGAAGDREALFALGQLHLRGQGVERDEMRAAELFRQAADLDHAAAAREFGYLLLQGKGEDQNAMLAAAYLRRAASLGDMDAQYALAGLYVEGVGIVADEALAARWFGEAARNGHIGAQVEYALMLYNGRGISRNAEAAVYWLKRAAESDNPVAQLRLAKLLAEGRAVSENRGEAARWYLIAKAQGLEDESMEDFLKRLDAGTRDNAAAAAARWTGAVPRTQAALSPDSAPAPVDNRVE